MIRLSEVCRRAQTGLTMSAHAFGLGVVFANVSRPCEEYGFACDGNRHVPSDDDLADRALQAAVDLIVDVGVCRPDTGSVKQSGRHEVLDAVARSLDRCIMGDDNELATKLLQKYQNTIDGAPGEGNVRIGTIFIQVSTHRPMWICEANSRKGRAS